MKTDAAPKAMTMEFNLERIESCRINMVTNARLLFRLSAERFPEKMLKRMSGAGRHGED